MISKDILLFYGWKKCHSRVLGILADFAKQQNYVVDIQRAIEFDEPIKGNRNQYQATPDLVFLTPRNSLIIAEYESIDAGSGVFPKKMDYFSRYGSEDEIIEGYIFLTTMFSEEVIKNTKGIPNWAREACKNRTENEKQIFEKAREITSKRDLFFLYGRFDDNGIRFHLFRNGLEKKMRRNIFNW